MNNFIRRYLKGVPYKELKIAGQLIENKMLEYRRGTPEYQNAEEMLMMIGEELGRRNIDIIKEVLEVLLRDD